MVRLAMVVVVAVMATLAGNGLWQRYHCHVEWAEVRFLQPIPCEQVEIVAAQQEELRAMACQYPYRKEIESCQK